MSQVLNIMYIFIHLRGNMQYLLSVTYVIVCTGFVFGLEIIHRACDCSTAPFISSPPGVIAIGGLQSCILLCDSNR